jgi:hypothetical protein
MRIISCQPLGLYKSVHFQKCERSHFPTQAVRIFGAKTSGGIADSDLLVWCGLLLFRNGTVAIKLSSVPAMKARHIRKENKC